MSGRQFSTPAKYSTCPTIKAATNHSGVPSRADSSSPDRREVMRAIRSKASTETPREQCLTIGAALSWQDVRALVKGSAP